MDDLRTLLDGLAADMPFAAVKALLEMGVPAVVVGGLTARGDLAVAGIELSRDRFTLPGPTRRLLLAVRDAAGEVVDLAALSSTDENEWATMLGAADLLGEAALEHAIATEAREVRLFATPMAWLRGGGDLGSSSGGGSPQENLCVLDWTKSALGALRGLREWQTIVVDAGGRAKLEALLAHGGLPLVAEDRRQLRRAA